MRSACTLALVCACALLFSVSVSFPQLHRGRTLRAPKESGIQQVDVTSMTAELGAEPAPPQDDVGTERKENWFQRVLGVDALRRHVSTVRNTVGESWERLQLPAGRVIQQKTEQMKVVVIDKWHALVRFVLMLRLKMVGVLGDKPLSPTTVLKSVLESFGGGRWRGGGTAEEGPPGYKARAGAPTTTAQEEPLTDIGDITPAKVDAELPVEGEPFSNDDISPQHYTPSDVPESLPAAAEVLTAHADSLVEQVARLGEHEDMMLDDRGSDSIPSASETDAPLEPEIDVGVESDKEQATAAEESNVVDPLTSEDTDECDNPASTIDEDLLQQPDPEFSVEESVDVVEQDLEAPTAEVAHPIEHASVEHDNVLDTGVGYESDVELDNIPSTSESAEEEHEPVDSTSSQGKDATEPTTEDVTDGNNEELASTLQDPHITEELNTQESHITEEPNTQEGGLEENEYALESEAAAESMVEPGRVGSDEVSTSEVPVVEEEAVDDVDVEEAGSDAPVVQVEEHSENDPEDILDTPLSSNVDEAEHSDTHAETSPEELADKPIQAEEETLAHMFSARMESTSRALVSMTEPDWFVNLFITNKAAFIAWVIMASIIASLVGVCLGLSSSWRKYTTHMQPVEEVVGERLRVPPEAILEPQEFHEDSKEQDMQGGSVSQVECSAPHAEPLPVQSVKTEAVPRRNNSKAYYDVNNGGHEDPEVEFIEETPRRCSLRSHQPSTSAVKSSHKTPSKRASASVSMERDVPSSGVCDRPRRQSAMLGPGSYAV